MDKQGDVMFMDKGLGDAQLPNTDYQIIKAEFDRLCDEQESLYKPDFEAVFKELHKLDATLTQNYPYTTDEALLNEALRLAGFETDEAFCVDFKKYNALFVEGKALQAKGLGLLAKEYAQKHQNEISVERWHFVPISIVGNPDVIKWVDEKMMSDAQEGKGLFANHFPIPQEDELLDEFLGVEAYGLKCSFVPFLDELKRFGIVDGQEPFFSKELTRGLFATLKQAANYMKENTDKPQAIKNEIARLVNCFDSIPIWGFFFQILILQGLCRLLEGVNINEGDNGYNEASSLYEWLYLELAKKEFDFCYKPYGAKDREQLKPLCAYLMSTEVGQLVQSKLFGNEPQPEQANDRKTTDAQSVNPEPQLMALKNLLPEKLKADEAVKVFENAIDAKLITNSPEGLKWNDRKQLLAYFATKVSDKFILTTKHDKDGNKTTDWKSFETLFKVRGLKAAKQNWMRICTKFEPTGFEKVDALFF